MSNGPTFFQGQAEDTVSVSASAPPVPVAVTKPRTPNYSKIQHSGVQTATKATGFFSAVGFSLARMGYIFYFALGVILIGGGTIGAATAFFRDEKSIWAFIPMGIPFIILGWIGNTSVKHWASGKHTSVFIKAVALFAWVPGFIAVNFLSH